MDKRSDEDRIDDWMKGSGGMVLLVVGIIAGLWFVASAVWR